MRRALIWFLIAVSCGSAFLIFIRFITEPPKETEIQETTSEGLFRMYENFLHKTKNNYQKILKSGTSYDRQDQVFLEFTQKLQDVKMNPDDYSQIRKKFLREITRNRIAFELFYLKVSHSNPEDVLKNLNETKEHVDDRNKKLEATPPDDGKTKSTSDQSRSY